ncbi:MAG: methylthioribulose 1-phosphate dehydratase [Deltaproteobacteria bacterium CG17_big_fil_post_rev_8_21_14_2_50_63_7]|nr:MAG: methylthioribulose 1-phosphate dehydratase [Deltaproteobacteria bacterium CG17_big_fil_post_rev_8_21_14_2_50_63_7]
MRSDNWVSNLEAATARVEDDPRRRIAELCAHFYSLGWVSGTGGGIALRRGDSIFMAPSGVQKEKLKPADIFELNLAGEVISRSADPKLRVSACKPLFYHAFNRGAGAVLHSHSMSAMLATLVFHNTFEVTHLEMMKGIVGVQYEDTLTIPIIENTPHKADLADAMADAMRAYPRATAVLVRRHGVYIWGKDWVETKTQAECYDYLFDAVVRMKQLFIDPARRPDSSRQEAA